MAYAGDLKSLAARIVGSSPTAPTTYCLRAVSPRDAGSFPSDAGGARTREGASVKRTRSVRSEPARAPAGDRSRCVFAQQIHRRPTAPTTYCLRARVPQGCGLVSLDASTDGELRWNSSCLCRLPAYLGTISPQLRLILAHFSMEKRVCLPHFLIERCGCLAHFPREMRIWPYTIRKGWEAICSDSL